MDVKQTSCCSVVDSKSRKRFICFTRRRDEVCNVCLTDAADVWSSEFTADTLDQFRQKFALQSTDDFLQIFKSSSIRGALSVVVDGFRADLSLGPGPADLSLTLNRLESPEAKEELKDLLFRMVDSSTQTSSECVSSSISPLKTLQRTNEGLEPRQQHGAPPPVTLRKRLPGSSLINPGAKKKVRATGVAFDDAEED